MTMSNAAAEYAATRAVLQIMLEQDQHEERLIALETENRSMVATEEANALSRRLQAEREEAKRKVEEASRLKKQQEEHAARQKAVEQVKRELERLEHLKRLNAAKARLQVYDVDSDPESNPQYCKLPMVEQAVKYQHPVYHYTELSHVASEKALSNPAQEGAGGLVKVLSEAILANRLPIPEPTIFTGDALKFGHWKSSFQMLIERKNIPTTEKLFFLQRYVGGRAKEAIEGYFMIDADDAYQAAWNHLQERYGKPFVIAKAFRDKIYSWPKMASRESGDLRKFVDFFA